MHRISIMLAVFTATTAIAQAPSSVPSGSDASAIVVQITPAGTDCPVDFRAERRSTGQVLSANDAAKNGPALGLHLTLDHLAAPAIESIEVTVYGVSPRGRIVPANFQAADANTRDTVSKSFLLQRSASDKTLSSADVWLQQAGALRWVDLNEVRYADGTIWRPSGSAKCRAVPSGFVLVGQR